MRGTSLCAISRTTSLHKRLHCLRIVGTQQQCRTITSPTIHRNSLLESGSNSPFLHYISSNPFVFLLRACKNESSLKEIHSLLIIHGQTEDLILQTKLVSLYGALGDVRSARLVFDQMPNPDIFTCKAMIRWYFINDLHSETVGFYSCMRRCLREHDDIVFSIVLKACSELRDLRGGRKLHCLVVKAGPDSLVLTNLADMYAKCGEVTCSHQVFDEIPDGNVVCWTSMIVGYVQNGYSEEALMIFNRMRNGLVEGNQHTFGCVIVACAKLRALHQGKWVHGYVKKNGVNLNSHLTTSLVDMYVQCGAIHDARSAFDELPTVDLVSWMAMIMGYTQCGYPDEALALFANKKWSDVIPNSVTTASVIAACAQSANLDVGRTVHGLGIKLGLEDLNVKNALEDMYAKCKTDWRCLLLI